MPLNGVRMAATHGKQGFGINGMENAMALSLRKSVDRVLDPKNLDESVEEVFGLMLGVECRRRAGAAIHQPSSEPESVTAVVGFGGMLSGACVFKCGAKAAMSMAAHMTGLDFHEIDDTVKDGIGELCNMLAGAWKGKVPDLSANCGLSVPAVITGRDYKLHVQAPEFQLQHAYEYDDASFSVTIVCDGLQ